MRREEGEFHEMREDRNFILMTLLSHEDEIPTLKRLLSSSDTVTKFMHWIYCIVTGTDTYQLYH